jgi:hypothetical protein
MIFVQHDAPGRITGLITSSADDAPYYPDAVHCDDTDNISPRAHYILNGQVTERPASPVTLTDLTLNNLPVGGDLFIDGTRYEITDETVELEFPLPGTFNLRVERFPYLDWTGSVTA